MILSNFYTNGNPFHEYRYLGKHGVTMENWQLGHYNVKARHYDASVGRFLSEDPIWSTNLYPYSENNPISKIDPNGESAVSYSDIGPYGVGLEWLSGTGPRHRNFSDGDYFTSVLRDHHHILASKKAISGLIQNGATFGKNNYSLSGISGASQFVSDYSSVLSFGQTGNLAGAFLGSYGLSWNLQELGENSAVVLFTVNNSSTIQSATRPPIIGYTSWWQNTIGAYLNRQIQNGPLSKTTQTFQWSETITW